VRLRPRKIDATYQFRTRGGQELVIQPCPAITSAIFDFMHNYFLVSNE
jgi:hypothetical protein